MELDLQSSYNKKDRAQTAHIRSRLIKRDGLMPPLQVGNEKWYRESIKNLEKNKNFRIKTRQEVCRGRLEGHLPVSRDYLINETNKNIHRYNREVNSVVYW